MYTHNMTRWFLNRKNVLVLNRNWQAIDVKTPLEAIGMMYSNDATGLDVRGEDYMVPLPWKEWVELEVTDDSEYIGTVQGKIKAPVIIILCRYDKVPHKRPKFTTKNIWQRDGGICQYTGKKLTPNEGNIDHVIPKSRGGKSTWTNCVLCHKDVNSLKADRTPAEAGLKLLKTPKEPASMPTIMYIDNKYEVPEWRPFLYRD